MAHRISVSTRQVDRGLRNTLSGIQISQAEKTTHARISVPTIRNWGRKSFHTDPATERIEDFNVAKMGVPTAGVGLFKAYPQFVELLEDHPSNELREGILHQLRSVHVPSQMLGGTPNHFQFMAHPFPQLSYEQRQTHPISPEVTVEVLGKGWKVAIDIDIFGRINWFYVEGIPQLYDALRPYLPMD
jgi:hypothetical protein